MTPPTEPRKDITWELISTVAVVCFWTMFVLATLISIFVLLVLVVMWIL